MSTPSITPNEDLDSLAAGSYTILATDWATDSAPPLPPRGILVCAGEDKYGKTQTFFSPDGVAIRTLVGAWGPWLKLLDAQSATEHFVLPTGENAVGKWKIDILGSAISARTAVRSDSTSSAPSYLNLAGGVMEGEIQGPKAGFSELQVGEIRLHDGVLSGHVSFESMPVLPVNLWHDKNMGAGSGLDADTVRGLVPGEDFPLLNFGVLSVDQLVIAGMALSINQKEVKFDTSSLVIGDTVFCNQDGFGIKNRGRWQLKYDEKSSTFLVNNKNAVLHDGNFQEYTVGQLGENAKGLWPIDISGDARTVSGMQAKSASVPNTIVARDSTGGITVNSLNLMDYDFSSTPTAIVGKSGSNQLKSLTAGAVANFIEKSFGNIKATSVATSMVDFGSRAITNTTECLVLDGVKISGSKISASEISLIGVNFDAVKSDQRENGVIETSLVSCIRYLLDKVDALNTEIEMLKTMMKGEA